MNNIAPTHFPIDDRLATRWSPYVFSEQPVPRDTLRSVFEAARWSASSFNEQPWRFLVSRKNRDDTHDRIVNCLAEGNQVWAKHAPVLLIGIYRHRFAESGKENKAAPHDLGLAAGQMVFEASRHDLFVHMMIGLDPAAARRTFGIPNDAEAYTAMAIGYRDAADNADASLREREAKPCQRLPQCDFVFSNQFGTSAEF
ncbi:MAG: nitroreductase [Xanthomonadales bacterium]|nr:nitroreductase [Xanthomonadales bacterium]|tara:strand:- start:215 stop:811 length:597 start_codon:yes stop_codon:yes gene_type:complete